MPGEHITNLEAPERMAREAAQAESALMAGDPDDPQLRSALTLAKSRLKGNTDTMDLLEREFGPVMVGKPRKTKFKTAEMLESQGYVGIYRRG